MSAEQSVQHSPSRAGLRPTTSFYDVVGLLERQLHITSAMGEWSSLSAGVYGWVPTGGFRGGGRKGRMPP